jgi:activator of 2-hydroxyglutaryl-CoA dehydratase
MVAALEAKLGMPLNRSPESHFTGALGAALFALDRVLAQEQPSEVAALGVPAWADE